MCRWSMSVQEKWPENNMHTIPAGLGLRTGMHRLGYPCNRKRVGDLLT